MRIAIEGCAHGELDIIYNSIKEVEQHSGKKIDLLLCCGDFQSARHVDDLSCMAVPDKYKQIRAFHKYYSGQKCAPVLTIFIGGNHEASNYLQELPYGGWVAPNIYYMGYANVINIGGIRIAGISGIYKAQHLSYGHFELPPYNPSTIRSVYHTRNIEIFRLKQLSGQIDIFLSHDWPCGITKYGNEKELIKKKPFLKNDIENNKLGSPPCMELLKHHHPYYWFSAHLHCKYAALVPNEETNSLTKFLALDKCLPKRKFLQILDLPHNGSKSLSLSYDLEWLTILYLTNHLLNVKNSAHTMPTSVDNGRWKYTPTESEKESILRKFDNLEVPINFEKIIEPFQSQQSFKIQTFSKNNQTITFCQRLGIDNPLFLLQIIKNKVGENSKDNFSSEKKLHQFPKCTELFQDTFCDHKSVCNNVLNDNAPLLCISSPTVSSIKNSSIAAIHTSEEPTIKKLRKRNSSIYESFM